MLVRLSDYAFGARLTTDLVNTAPAVMVSTGEGLPDPDELLAFLADRGVHPDALAAGRRPTDTDVVAVRELRTLLRAIVDEPDAERAVIRAGALTAATGVGPQLRRDGTRWHWFTASRPGAGLADELALLAATGLLGVVRTLGSDRFRQCAAPTCAGAFVDTSRAGRRRYCEPEVCGNRVNVANHRARRRDRAG